MKKVLAYLMIGTSLAFTSCDSLDLEPTSTIIDGNFWKSNAQFSAFSIGLHAQFREKAYNYFVLGEPRADYFAGTTAFSSAAQGNEHMWYNTINKMNPAQSNYAGLYSVINQLNLMINKGGSNTTLDAATRNYYLGQAYGMRAYLYLHLLRSWGDVVIWTNHTEESTIDLSNLTKAASPASEVMQLIVDDVTKSENAFGDNYSFRNGSQRYFWSKAATMMLKAEVYLWRARQMGGGTADYTIAKNALLDIKGRTSQFELLEKFTDVFAYDNKNNKEIIFAVRNARNEYNLWGDNNFSGNMLPQQNILFGYYDENGVVIKTLGDRVKVNGTIRYPLNKEFYLKGFHDKDTRKRGTIQAAYSKDKETNALTYYDAYPCKFLGTLLAGSDTRSSLDDYPIYRYADCLLLLGLTKAFLGEDPAEEINAVRKRAYGATYFEANEAQLAYPNDNDATLYTNNKSQKADNVGAIDAVLKERMREFMLEGKRWYDLRLAGWEYVNAHTSAAKERLLWPIDENTLTNNKKLEQTPGYKNY